MIKEPKLPHKLKWGDRTAARAGEAEYLTGIGVAGYTSLKDVIIAEVHESAADGAGAWSMPEDLRGRRQQRRVHEEAAGRGLLQVHKA